MQFLLIGRSFTRIVRRCDFVSWTNKALERLSLVRRHLDVPTRFTRRMFWPEDCFGESAKPHARAPAAAGGRLLPRGFKIESTTLRSGLIRQRIPMSTAPLVCHVCKKSKSPNSGMIAELIRPSLLEFIKKKVPDLDSKAFICFDDLGEFRKDYVKEVLEDEIGELTALDQEVIESLEQHEILSSDIEKQFEQELTFGERLSDRIAEFGGSWKFS